ncbi:MAG TPA: histidine kinase, partial [Pseudomonadales bacterium]|nr:histidine kinase [Pseudomonadales bacterium]
MATLFATPQQSLPRTDRQVVRVYLYYRLILAIVLLVMRFGDEGQIHLGQLLPRLYLSVALCYLLSALLAPLLHALLFGSSLNTARLFALFSFDILLFTLLMYSSSGVTSGLGNLSLIAVAAGNILLQGRIGTLLAALATLLVIGEEGYLLLTALPPGEESNRFFQAGVLGTLYFAIALGMQMLSRRLLASDELARQRARDISELQQLNHMIIQRMRTGILVLDRNDDIRMINRA